MAIARIWMVRMSSLDRLLRFARNDGEMKARNDGVGRACITAVIASRACAAWQSLPRIVGVESALGQLAAYSPTILGLAWSDLFPSRLLRHFVPRNDGEWGARRVGERLLRNFVPRNDGEGVARNGGRRLLRCARNDGEGVITKGE